MSDNPPKDPFGGESDPAKAMLNWHLHMIQLEQRFCADIIAVVEKSSAEMQALDAKHGRRLLYPTVMLAVVVGLQQHRLAVGLRQDQAELQIARTVVGLGFGYLFAKGLEWLAKRSLRKKP
jgi:hypothetical protein